MYAFLTVAVRAGTRETMEALACGRIALEDVGAMVELRRLGLLEPPAFMPRWLSNWRELLPFFAFSSFVAEVDLRPVEERHRHLLEEQREEVDAEPVSAPA